MAKQIEGVSERILACAKAEFLGDAMTEKVLHIVTPRASRAFLRSSATA